VHNDSNAKWKPKWKSKWKDLIWDLFFARPGFYFLFY
jgi:hypothetical protein